MPTIPVLDWYEKAADAIVRNGKTLFQYTNETNRGLTSKECESIARTKEFQAVLRTARNKHFKELATDPSRSRNTAVGQLLYLVQKLIDIEQYDKAANALDKLFKVEGWSSDAAQINVFNDLGAKDIEDLRKKLMEKK